MKNTPINLTVGTSFSSLLGLVLITLKLTHLIDWAWIWVLAPFWVLPLIAFSVCLVFAIILFVGWVDDRTKL